MTTRKASPKVDATHDAFMAASTPAQAARALNVSGKWLRDILRKQGTYVSRGGVFDDATKEALYVTASARIASRSADK